MEFTRIADIKRLHFIIDNIRKHAGDKATVLDVGCGNGVISRSVGAEGFEVFGIDISEKAIEKAEQLNKYSNVSFEVKSAEQLVAEGKKYKAVICSEVLEHLNEPSKLLKVLYQSIADDGILIVTVPNGNGPREVMVTKPVIALQKKNNVTWKIIQKTKKALGYSGTTAQSDASDLTHIQFFTKKTLQNLAKENDFNITHFGKTNFVEDIFPFSFLTKKFKFLQKLDCAVAEYLPYSFTGGFVTVWKKN